MADRTTVEKQNILTRIVGLFLRSQLPLIFIFFALVLGIAAVFLTPREEDPQIVVPMADVYVRFPGASAEEVEKLVATPLERLLWQIDGVEYVYSMSRRDLAIVTVRFFVGHDMVESLVRLHNTIRMNVDKVPPGVKGWVVKPVEIDDVPIVTLTLHSDRYDDHHLHRMAEEILARLEGLADISSTSIVGGRHREIRIELDPLRLAGLGISPLEVSGALQGADVSVTAGSFARLDRELTVSVDSFIESVQDVEQLMVGVHAGRPVYLRDIARVIDGPAEATSYSRIGFSNRYVGAHPGLEEGRSYPAVTLALAKKKGTNAVTVADNILARMAELQKTIIPEHVRVEVTRNSGDTASQKVDDLLLSLTFAVITVVALIAFTMGWREGLVVAVSVPITFSLCLFVNFLAGYTINRVTLFALILSLGLVVDDPITNVDNIQRHILLGRRQPRDATLFGVNEVLPPVIMSTLAIIVSFAPMFFITGMMGPYMAPMAVNVPLAVSFSTLNALIVVPWLSYHLLKNKATGGKGQGEGRDVTPVWIRKTYRRLLQPLLESKLKSSLMLSAVVLLLLFSVALALFRVVPLKMLPFDNKSEFQIVIDMAETASLEATDRVVRDFEAYLRRVPEVTNFVTYSGAGSPMDFNGMVRHYYLRSGPNMADIRVNLVDKNLRQQQSHEIVLRLRNDLMAIASRHNAAIKLVETPPGPPVIATIAAEIYGDADKSYPQLLAAADYVRTVMAQEENVLDIDDIVETPRKKLNFIIDKEKSSLHGVSSETIATTLRLALAGASPATVHLPRERHPLRMKLVLPRELRSGAAELSRLAVKGADGAMVELAELGKFVGAPDDQTIYHKNLERVAYVFGEVVGRAPAEPILDMQSRVSREPLPPGTRVKWDGEGEWHITLKVFRDLGIAFGVAMLGIYLLLIIQTGSYLLPWTIMTAIPLTLIGIMPGFWLIGMIALGGIVVRNSIVLIEFIHDALQENIPFKEAIIESGAVRMRPILLTALTTALGAWPITLDPIFSGLAWALIFGLFASTLFTLVVVPVVYYLLYRRRYVS
jgi:multidrug efflux pump subunit AcrB